MDDLGEKLGEILADEEKIGQIMALANKLKDDESTAAAESTDADSLKRIMAIIGEYKRLGDDEDAALIRSLIPHLAAKRQQKAQNAIKMMKIMRLLPLIKDTGLFDSL